jgi:DNA polymerase-3 subunit alpha
MTSNLSLVFDLETTGLPLKWNINPFIIDNYANARVIEIGYVIVNDDDGTVLKKVNHLTIHQDVLEIKNSHIHGITTEKMMLEGIKFEIAIDEFFMDLKTVDTIVSHNMAFDYNVLLSELYRKYNKSKLVISEMYRKKQYCTMINGQSYLKLNRWPKLVFLYKDIFGEDWEQTHRALDDAEICSRCYLHLIREIKN